MTTGLAFFVLILLAIAVSPVIVALARKCHVKEVIGWTVFAVLAGFVLNLASLYYGFDNIVINLMWLPWGRAMWLACRRKVAAQ